MKKLFFHLIIIGAVSVLPILFFFTSYYFNKQQLTYNFQRNLSYQVKNIKTFDLRYNSYYIAGQSNNDIYLGNSMASLHVLKINYLLTDTQSANIEVNKAILKPNGLYMLHVDSTKFHLFNGNDRSVLSGKTGLWKASTDSIFTPYFSQTATISNQSMVFRYISSKTGNNAFRKVSLPNSTTIENENILEKQIDGLFCTDGVLEYNHHLNKLIYLYYYRNQILLIDTNLKLIKKIKTIDPIDSVKFKVSKIKSENSVTLSSPSLIVNARCSTWNKYLFVQSKLMGQHEDETLFKTSTVIDVYDLETYKYRFSIYLPNFNNKPIRQFKVTGNYIYTLSDQFITMYTINLSKS